MVGWDGVGVVGWDGGGCLCSGGTKGDANVSRGRNADRVGRTERLNGDLATFKPPVCGGRGACGDVRRSRLNSTYGTIWTMRSSETVSKCVCRAAASV